MNPGSPMPAQQPSRRVLLIAPRFFGYETEIVEEFQHQDADVDLLPDRPFDSPLLKAATRYHPALTSPAADRFFDAQLQRLARGGYDLILVVQGESVSAQTLLRMRAHFPRARLVFYTWDSLGNKPFAVAKLSHYDQCLSFDPADAARYGMRSRPLFFTRGFERPIPSGFRVDISFIGTIHSDRYRVVRRIAARLPPGTRADWYLYVQAPWMYWARRIFTRQLDGSNRAEFRFKPLARTSVQDIYFASRSILDVEHPKQHGLTMRTIETMGSGTKLITTNAAVREYDFFDPRNICIIDRSDPWIGADFFETPYQAVPSEVYARYKLSRWVEDVCAS